MATVVLELELVGSAGGVPVELAGAGSVDVEAGRLALEVRVARPLLLLDPALVALGLLDVLALAAGCPGTVEDGDDAEHDPDAADADVDPAPESHVHVRLRTDLYDENGRDAGGWRIVAALGRTRGGLRVDGQFLDHVAHIEPGERVVAVDAPWATLAQPLEPEGVMLAGAWDARTGRGNGYRGVTTAVGDGWGWPAGWDGSEVLRVAIDEVRVRHIGESGSPGETVSIAARGATELLSRPPR